MALVKFADSIRSAASGFLATCTCDDSGTCTCSYDGQHLFSTSKKGNSEMSTILDKMSATERKELAAKIESAAAVLGDAERRDLIATLSAALGDDLKAKQAAERKAKVLANIQATRTDTTGTGKKEFDYLQTHLRAKGITEPLEALVWKTEKEIDAIFAKAGLLPKYAIGAKRFMSRMCNGQV
jgi:hypothetical protein